MQYYALDPAEPSRRSAAQASEDQPTRAPAPGSTGSGGLITGKSVSLMSIRLVAHWRSRHEELSVLTEHPARSAMPPQ